MKKILFVCHGNICRSPMAEYVMKDLVKKAGLATPSILRRGASWSNTESPAAVTRRGSSLKTITRNSICSSAWTAPTCGICTVSAAVTRMAGYTCCWITPTPPAMLPTRGTPRTSSRLGGMCWRAARDC